MYGGLDNYTQNAQIAILLKFIIKLFICTVKMEKNISQSGITKMVLFIMIVILHHIISIVSRRKFIPD